MYLPCSVNEVAGLECGDGVLVDMKHARVVGRNGDQPPPGDVVPVEAIPGDLPGQVIVRHQSQEVAAELSAKLQRDDLPIGTRVLYDPIRRFVSHVVEAHSSGEELLTDISVLDKIDRSQLGAPHPILEQMLFRMKAWIEHPDYVTQLGARSKMSYLIVGPTGSGKTFHLQVLARELTDFLEELTGERVSRLVTCDASDFYTSLFGETEQRIVNWFSRLETLGKQTLRTRDGAVINPPLMVVFEEVEWLRARGETGGSSHLFDRPLTLLLQKLSAVADVLDVPILFAATTNRPDLIDAAVRRRLGVVQVYLGTLNASQAHAVLEKKIHANMPLRGEERQDREQLRSAVLEQTVGYLFGTEPQQAIAEVQFVNSERRMLERRDVVTASMLEDAVATAIDQCLRQSVHSRRLQGIDAAGIIRALERQYYSLALTLRAHNVREYVPEWFADESVHVTNVRPLVKRSRAPRATMIAPAV
jgi:hypothetical protein